MKLGRMSERITFEKRQCVQDGDGFNEEQWNVYKTVWADIQPISSKEVIDGNGELETISNRIYIRYLSGIDSTMRIVCKERVFEIVSIIGERRSGMQTVVVREVL